MGLVLGFVAGAILGWASTPSAMIGDWETPGGSVVRVAECGQAICLTVVKLASDVAVKTDKRNPNEAMRTRPLCGLRIGEGFVADGEKAASGGKVYDPESGKTYSGKIALDGDRLKLRGYIGVSLFGRSETWKRTETIKACQ